MYFYENVITNKALLLKIQINLSPPSLIPIYHSPLYSQRCIPSMHQKIVLSF